MHVAGDGGVGVGWGGWGEGALWVSHFALVILHCETIINPFQEISQLSNRRSHNQGPTQSCHTGQWGTSHLCPICGEEVYLLTHCWAHG